MANLSRELRIDLDKIVSSARVEAEAGARKAVDQLALAHHEPWPTMTSDQQKLRRRLRARGRQLGDRPEGGTGQGLEHLVAECAYEHWHRMLFARFLAECGLLIEPESGVSISIAECKDLARERGADWISLASQFAQGMLPQIFRADDAVLEISFPPENRQSLEQLLISIPSEVFLADDGLGWVYQFWQSTEKKRINKSGSEIGPNELSAVTQLFTEDYMVDFLLHNTLGAWWAGRRFPQGVEADSEEDARLAVAVQDIGWRSLRFHQLDTGKWTPSAGTFDAWPTSSSGIRVLDPCMGSGHFLVVAVRILAALRASEERVSMADACRAVLNDNLFGLEIDPRCTQIAAFNVALTAWKIAGWQVLPPLNLACSGLAPNASREDWMMLAGDDDNASRGMEQLFELFAQGPVVGSLIDPRRFGGTVLAKGFHDLKPLLGGALREETINEESLERAVTAKGIAKASQILAGQFALVVTNVPYLKRGKQAEPLQAYCEEFHPDAKANLASVFADRCLSFCAPGGTTASVIINELLFLGTYKRFRKRLLIEQRWNSVARLGPGAFEAITGEVVNVSLITMSRLEPDSTTRFLCLDVAEEDTPSLKARALREVESALVLQALQNSNPDSRIACGDLSSSSLLSRFAAFGKGSTTGDSPRFLHCFWEYPMMPDQAVPWLDSPNTGQLWSGRRLVLNTSLDSDDLLEQNGCRIHGQEVWNRLGIAVNKMSGLEPFVFAGEVFDDNVGAIVPRDPQDIPAILAYCQSGEYLTDIKRIDQAIKVTAATLVKVPFDQARWRNAANAKYPYGLPKPDSDDPAQWPFDGGLTKSRHPLHVAVAKLLGYQWPRQRGTSFPECPVLDADDLGTLVAPDGIVCIPQVQGHEPASARLLALLASAYGADWRGEVLDKLLAQTDFSGGSLEEWLRDDFFRQHCDIFRQRPFVWQVWDGLSDGFSALLNYHKLTKLNLEKLTFGYLGDWIRRQEAAVGAGEPGSDSRLLASKRLQTELKLILDGEPPYDIFVRWKSLVEQPIGWNPDLNDGVLVNARPFVLAADLGKKNAGVLRAKLITHRDRDPGTEPSRPKDDYPWFWAWDGVSQDFAGGSNFDGKRWNHLHYSHEFKTAARRQRGVA